MYLFVISFKIIGYVDLIIRYLHSGFDIHYLYLIKCYRLLNIRYKSIYKFFTSIFVFVSMMDVSLVRLAVSPMLGVWLWC